MGSLIGKSVVITGAGRGLGAAYARLAATEGAAVVVNDRDAEAAADVTAQITADGGTAIAVVADISDWSDAERLVETCVSSFGRIDGLVNNAGVEHLGLSWDVTERDVLEMVQVNVLGTLYCGTHAMAQMVPQGSGSIVNVTSGAHMGLGHLSVYGATKGATASVTYCWAVDLEGTGVRANAISPLAATRMSEKTADYMGQYGMTRSQFLDGFPTAADNAPLVSYLLSDRSSAINGQIARMDSGGISLVSHPSVMPGVTSSTWTVDTVAAVFDSVLATQQHPLGVSPTPAAAAASATPS